MENFHMKHPSSSQLLKCIELRNPLWFLRGTDVERMSQYSNVHTHQNHSLRTIGSESEVISFNGLPVICYDTIKCSRKIGVFERITLMDLMTGNFDGSRAILPVSLNFIQMNNYEKRLDGLIQGIEQLLSENRDSFSDDEQKLLTECIDALHNAKNGSNDPVNSSSQDKVAWVLKSLMRLFAIDRLRDIL